MIPRVAKSGRSFKGAMLYYSHDKEANTSERLGFVELVNLPILQGDDRVRDLERAGAVMAWTAIHQEEIKQHHHHQTSPGTPFRRSGRKLEKPVYSFSLRFSPEDALKVDDTMLKRAAHGALKTLGMDHCQAAIIQHKDSIPPHVHVIVCPINPKTGNTVSRQKDFYKLSTFAQNFSRDHGLRILEVRESNNARRRRGEIVKYPDLPRSEWELMQGYRGKTRKKVERERHAQQDAERQQLAERQRIAIAKFKAHIAATYANDRRNVQSEITAINNRLTRKGLFAAAARKLARLSGAEKRDRARLVRLIKSRDNIDARVREARKPFSWSLRTERLKMIFRHDAELLRDDQYFAARERQRTDGDRRAAKLAKAQYVQAARDRKHDGLETALQSLRAPSGDATDFVSDDNELGRIKKQWSRAQGRNPDRPYRPRNPDTRDADADTPSPDHPRRRRRRR